MWVAHKVLHKLGATQVRKIDGMEDPTCEEEFLLLDYDSPSPISWNDYLAKYDEVVKEAGKKLIRFERTIRLSKCDWIMTIDNIDILANKDEWIAYRQALRDLPDNMPPLVWKGPQELDFSKMNMPVQPPIVRIPKPT
jgi:hypothetical protein